MLYTKKDNTQALNLELVTAVIKGTVINESQGGAVDSYRLDFCTNFETISKFSFSYEDKESRDQEYEAILRHINWDIPYTRSSY